MIRKMHYSLYENPEELAVETGPLDKIERELR